MKTGIAAFLICLLAQGASAGLLVTEVNGKAEVEGRGTIVTLMEIPDGSRLNLPAGSSLTVVDLASGREFLLKGGRKYTISENGPKALDGTPLESKPLPAKNIPEIRIGKGKAAQATLVMRGVRETAVPMLLSPVRTAAITTTPTFRWNAVESAINYRLILRVKDREPIWDVATRETELTLPADRALSAGQSYTWKIEAIGANGAPSDASTGFSVADAGAMERLAKLKPDGSAPFSRRVLYAAQLAESGAVAEAREAWKVLASERPDDAVLRVLAE